MTIKKVRTAGGRVLVIKTKVGVDAKRVNRVRAAIDAEKRRLATEVRSAQLQAEGAERRASEDRGFLGLTTSTG
jgi:hypothetical protein